jgi:hypothetical protein
MFSYSTGYYVSPPDDQYLKFKNRCSLLYTPRFIPPPTHDIWGGGGGGVTCAAGRRGGNFPEENANYIYF